MIRDTEKHELIEKYLADELTAAEQATFEELIAQDEDFKEAVNFQADFVISAKAVGRKELTNLFQEAEAELVAEKKAEPGLLAQIKEGVKEDLKKVAYTLEQLSQMFKPVPSYQMAIANTMRAGEVEIEAPENGADCNDGYIDFQLGRAAGDDMEIIIENNDYDILIDEEIPEGTTTFSYDLPADTFSPGRYYWKLMEDGEMVAIREFFIHKNLMPA